MDIQEYDDILRHLVHLATDQREFNRQQVEINTDIKTTLARVEMLVARMLRTEQNGHEA